MTHASHDVLIIGGGVAGLAMALELADHRRVTLLRPGNDDRGASRWAQGGIAAVLSPQDNIEAHVQDTLVAGDGLCDEQAVRFTVEQGPDAIDWLLQLGVPFTPETDPSLGYPYHLTREGGHNARRIIHAEDATGRAVIDTLRERALQHPSITLRDDLVAYELISNAQGQCCGARCLDPRHQVQELIAQDTVLATGGASGLYLHTTSPSPASGEGMAMAYDAGAQLSNLEFQQFHPTCLYDPEGPPFLISEAVRGEGGLLLNADGKRFMPDIDPRAELAPRDVVARAIDAEMQRTDSPCVMLDIRHLGAATIRHHFPTIHAHCLGRGLDITQQPIPVVPAAHYSCGGISVDQHGATSVTGLYAIGEVTCTGLHGANRMASNSLLECLVYARSAARHLATLREPPRQHPATSVIAGTRQAKASDIVELHQELRRVMSARVAIVRFDEGLKEAAARIETLASRYAELADDACPTPALLALRHALTLARLTVASALARRESRGLHYNPQCPRHADPAPQPSRYARH
ncbi:MULTISPECIES: L-aspartate oxidase [Halomonas]|uniref:L-aspartate oxidase n=1 Tax=Halomonas TaxID=2745 RepID=UPI001C946EDF|nr:MULTISPECIES: L-aspartate oxidase [Halomonas]MBY6209107.1 L-aspartate oxidase [Halomonas sp. DP3Y7-2]MBY6229263.1 L-aspartate oxidase [Halomonas sp. DP3Y7-1]MCA0917674.1 L-aspartate oxidase [Halomonas denitrificans]